MNILIISNLSNNIDAGLNWSVPASIKALEAIDNVLWIDLTQNAFMEHWGNISSYHNIKEYGSNLSLDKLPAPHNRPDIVVFEGFYYIEQVNFSRELVKNRIPYLIIPRGSFTSKALHNGSIIKFLKKKIAHFLIFNKYINNSLAIQYLTKQEKFDSELRFKHQSFIIPNGINLPDQKKVTFSKGVRAVYIGRQDIYQKGIDILLYSVANLKDELIAAGFKLDIYGPPRYDFKEISALINSLEIQSIVRNHEKGVSGKMKEDVLLDSDLFVLTSRFEGHPMGLIEALSYGVPVLITRGANMYDEVNDSRSGFVCETDIDSVTSALKIVIAEKSKLCEYGENARNLALEYDWHRLAKLFHNEVKNLINHID